MPEEEVSAEKIIEISVSPNKQDEGLSDFALNNLLPREKRPETIKMTMFIGEWYPSWRHQTKESIAFLRTAFERAADLYDEKSQDLVFLDLGSGDGMLPIVATASGRYKEACGIEIQPDLNKWATNNVELVEKSGLINPNKTKLGTGSYYTKYFLSKVTAQGGGTTEQAEDLFLEDTGMLDKNGKLKADVVCWYPSDPYIKSSKEHWDKILKPGTVLILAPSQQIEDVEEAGILDSFEHLVTLIRKDGEIGTLKELYLYKKKNN